MTSLPWLRLYTELLSDRKVKLISAETGLPKPLIIGVWVSLLMLAGESPERGRIISARGKPWPFHFIADEIGLDEATCQQIIGEFVAMDMIYQDEEGAYIITKWDDRQFKSDDSYARVKKFRANNPKDPEGEKGGIDNDGYTKRFNSDNRNASETFQETPQSQSQIQSQNPNGIGKKPEEKEPNHSGPRWQLMDEFVICSGIPLPGNKTDRDFWWSRIGAIYGIALEDVDIGKRLIKESVDKLRCEGLIISDPGSLVKTSRALMAKPNQKVSIGAK